ncbi:MAG: hypothetical protein U1F43_29780 [Myxococcota bacterium]
MGPAYSEAALLGYAYAFEQATHARTPPAYLPTLGAEPGAMPSGSRAAPGGQEP